MKKAFIPLAILLQFFVFEPSGFASARLDEIPALEQKAKHRQQHFRKQVLRNIFQKKAAKQKPYSKNRWLNFGWKALILWSVAAIAIFAADFIALGIITWAAAVILAIIGLFKDERKTVSIVALALLLPIGVLFAVYLSLRNL